MVDRGRPAGFRMGAEHRSKIGNSRILSRLIGHAEGTEEMSSTQVSAALGLLKKIMPDLAATQISGDEDNPLEINVSLTTEQRVRALAALLAKAKREK